MKAVKVPTVMVPETTAAPPKPTISSVVKPVIASIQALSAELRNISR
jgi:hypothetical protein